MSETNRTGNPQARNSIGMLGHDDQFGLLRFADILAMLVSQNALYSAFLTALTNQRPDISDPAQALEDLLQVIRDNHRSKETCILMTPSLVRLFEIGKDSAEISALFPRFSWPVSYAVRHLHDAYMQEMK